MTFEDFLGIAPYSLNKEEKEKMLTERLKQLTEKHRSSCKAYRDILDTISYDPASVRSYKDIPFLPVRLFKELSLKSVDDGEIVKTMTSSGTTGQRVSKIYLDKVTSSNQQKAMVKIVNDFLGPNRMPMIILDCPSVLKNRAMFSARGAGILGFSIFGAKKIYAFDDDMKLDVDGLREFLKQNSGQTVFMFGFTFMIWQYFYKELLKLREEGVVFDLSDCVLIHGGGWKKLASEAISPEEFRARLQSVCGLKRVHDYYGMVEQTGCIYMECECGHLHASAFSDVIVRDPVDFSECGIGKTGILQVVSTIPESYPGHSLLTEDEGVLLGEDDCPCGRKGKYFKILGRLKNAEIRGCSDTFAADHSALPVSPSDQEEKKDPRKLDKVRFLLGDIQTVMDMPSAPPLAPFSEEMIDFLDDLSKELMRSREARSFSDVVTLGFWLRRASVSKLKARFAADGENARIGRGVVFHIAPSNVPVNYAYSLFSGLMCGNANIVRVPTKDFPQVGIINAALRAVLEKHKALAPYVALVRYERSREINDVLSSLCDVRVVWGGDATIAEVRNSPLPPRATEITFADRYSLAVLDADHYMGLLSGDEGEKTAARIASDFYNDTFLSDQNACTSPRIVIWTGRARKEAQGRFWDALYALVKEKYPFQKIQAVDKLSLEYEACAAGLGKMREMEKTDNRLVRLQVYEASPRLMDYRGNCGYFYEYECEDILEIRDLCNDVRCQTIGVLGDGSLVGPVLRSGIKGVDRVVPIGHTMDFDLIWDGYDLVERMTRTVRVAI